MNKYRILSFILISLVFLVGWGKKNVELLNDKKLIDLNVAIENCIPGADASEESTDVTNVENVETEEHTEEAIFEEETTDKITIENTERIMVISVRNRDIFYNSVEYTNMDKLKEKMVQDNGKNVTFKLVDDFAEAHVYKEMISILAELKTEVGLKYTID